MLAHTSISPTARDKDYYRRLVYLNEGPCTPHMYAIYYRLRAGDGYFVYIVDGGVRAFYKKFQGHVHVPPPKNYDSESEGGID